MVGREVHSQIFHGPLPTCAGKFSGHLLIVGPARCMLEDVARVPRRNRIMAVNAVGMFLPTIDHWFSSHSDRFPAWQAVRDWSTKDEWRGYPRSCHTKHGKQGGQGDFLWPLLGRFANYSGISAAIVAVALGYDDILLAGLPADQSGHFYHSPVEPGWGEIYDHGHADCERAWTWCRDNYFQGKVKSLSGNTQRWLGE